jgi:hypothetical protein
MDNLFQTSSLNLVAWLLVKGQKIKDYVKIDNQTIFYFDRTDNLQDIINQYNNNVELKKFITKFREVRAIAKS